MRTPIQTSHQSTRTLLCVVLVLIYDSLLETPQRKDSDSLQDHLAVSHCRLVPKIVVGDYFTRFPNRS